LFEQFFRQQKSRWLLFRLCCFGTPPQRYSDQLRRAPGLQAIIVGRGDDASRLRVTGKNEPKPRLVAPPLIHRLRLIDFPDSETPQIA
jgi:hypothetical protein